MNTANLARISGTEIGHFHYLTTDAGGEFCDPELCPRCRGLSKLDQRDRLSRFLSDVMEKARPGIRIFNTAFNWERSRYAHPEPECWLL